MELARNKHFKAWIEKIYVGCHAMHKGMPEPEARAKFENEYLDDANMLVFILNSTFPNTKRVDDEYHFITKDDFVHKDIATGQTYNPGAMTLKISPNYEALLSFENRTFRHGHADPVSGAVICYGWYAHFSQSLCDIGLSGALMDFYNFGRVSKHDSHFAAEPYEANI